MNSTTTDLRQQAEKIASALKSASVKHASCGGHAVFGMLTNNRKFFKIVMTWDTIRSASSEALTEYLFKQMLEERDN